ncbi:hypothetical protein RJT34_05750 [Clitoria ternatea]|uniref:Protein kinase domain-containing protein n=1 Tax=Clitoria ternatea TaxID=43366 RepID=A0AAN9K1F9_CLITE
MNKKPDFSNILNHQLSNGLGSWTLSGQWKLCHSKLSHTCKGFHTIPFSQRRQILQRSQLLHAQERGTRAPSSRIFPLHHQHFGHDQTFEGGQNYYNLFLEYAAGGSLADHLKKHGGLFPEEHSVRRYTRSILEGLKHIHANGYVHCDVKLQNILIFDNDEVKIADFGLAKEEEEKKWECRGTPLFMSPESVNENEYESPADIWAFGCAVVEMVTGKPAWDVDNGPNRNM